MQYIKSLCEYRLWCYIAARHPACAGKVEEMMLIHNTYFGPCLDASGLCGFLGEGQWFHKFASFWFDFRGSTRVATTTTLMPNTGNMPRSGAKKHFFPREWIPRCIWLNPIKGLALNAVGLSNPGIVALINAGLLAETREPYMISVMPIEKSVENRLEEFRIIVNHIDWALLSNPLLRQCIGLQINVTCPNVGADLQKIAHEACGYLSNAMRLDIPLVVKLNMLVPTEIVGEIASHAARPGLCCTNTIPFGARIPDHLGKQIPWEELFPQGSPLKAFGGGGLSGKLLLPLVAQWIREVRSAGIMAPINAGGGILRPMDVDILVNAGLRRGLDSIFIGSIAMLRPWNIQPVIRRAHELLGIDND